MRVRRSALKHGISAHDSTLAARNCVYSATLDEEHPQREFRLGFDHHSRLLELVVLIWDDDTEEVIHAMVARKRYLSLLH